MPSDRDQRRRTPAGGVGARADPSDVEDTNAFRRAVRDTQQAANQASDRVGLLRTELGGRIDQLDAKVDNLALGAARVEGSLDVLTEELRAERATRAMIRLSSVQAEIEVEKTGEIAKLTEAAAVREHRRRWTIKAMAVVGPIITALIALLASRC